MTHILLGDALTQLKTLPDRCVHCCITSPPYYALRDYGIEGQIGLEKTPEEYIQKLTGVFREVRRVLREDGTLWLNISDTYSTGKAGMRSKNLLGIPWMLALSLRDDGWYLRQDIIWYKPNCMPESVKDRCTRSHEYLFLLSKSVHYYFDYKAIREPAVGFDTSSPRGSRGTFLPNAGRRKGNNRSFRSGGVYTNGRSFHNSADNQKQTVGNIPNQTGMRNKRDVWFVSTHGYKEAHFATFPPKLIEPCILAGCPVGGTVLDPFLGSGTTAEVAEKLERNCIGIELNSDYLALVKKRLNKGGVYYDV